jgi:hypothetical protein
MSSGKGKRTLRSTEWFGRHDRDALVHPSWMKNQGIPHDQFDGPVVCAGVKSNAEQRRLAWTEVD